MGGGPLKCWVCRVWNAKFPFWGANSLHLPKSFCTYIIAGPLQTWINPFHYINKVSLMWGKGMVNSANWESIGRHWTACRWLPLTSKKAVNWAEPNLRVVLVNPSLMKLLNIFDHTCTSNNPTEMEASHGWSAWGRVFPLLDRCTASTSQKPGRGMHGMDLVSRWQRLGCTPPFHRYIQWITTRLLISY